MSNCENCTARKRLNTQTLRPSAQNAQGIQIVLVSPLHLHNTNAEDKGYANLLPQPDLQVPNRRNRDRQHGNVHGHGGAGNDFALNHVQVIVDAPAALYRAVPVVRDRLAEPRRVEEVGSAPDDDEDGQNVQRGASSAVHASDSTEEQDDGKLGEYHRRRPELDDEPGALTVLVDACPAYYEKERKSFVLV